MKRRDFLKFLAGVLGGSSLAGLGCGRRVGKQTAVSPPRPPLSPTSPSPSSNAKVGRNRHDPHPVDGVDVAVSVGEDPSGMLKACLAAFGGIEAFVQRGDTVVIKPNLAWARSPEQAANVQPAVLAAVIKAAQAAGAGEVLVVEHSIDSAVAAFDLNGAAEVCKALKVPLIALDHEQMYERVAVSGVNIHEEQIARDILDCDCYINLACCKVHSASVVTLGLKNQMGAIWRPQNYHEAKSELAQSNNLHQNIADLATALRPTLTIVDCTRALLTNGPKGPGKTGKPKALVVSPDTVAADAVACEFLGVKPNAVAHITLAAKAGVGRWQNLAIKRSHA